MKFLKNYVLCIAILASFSGNAQHYNFKNYTTKNGLAHSAILQIIQDHSGFIWFATQGGLSRFDGKKFKNYFNSNGLPSNELNCLHEDHRNILWIGTSKGLCKYDGIKFTPVTTNGLTSSIYSIFEDSAGNCWFATRNSGLVRYDGKSFKQFTKRDGLPTDSLFSVMQDSEGDFWVGTYHYGVCKIEKKSFEGGKLNCKNYKKQDGLSSDNIFCILEVEPNTIWLGTTNGAITEIKNGKIEQKFISQDTKTDLINSLIKDKRGNIWIATAEHGLIKYKNENTTFYSEKNGLCSQNIFSLFEDWEGNIWVGTELGVSQFKNEAFITIQETNGLPSKIIQCFIETPQNTMLIGTANGLCEWNGSYIKVLSANIPGLANASVVSIAMDEDENFWIGTNEGVFICRYDKSFHLLRKISEVDGQFIYPVSAILKGKASRMYVSTFGSGLFVFDKEEVKHFGVKEGLKSESLYSVFEDNQQNIWLATYQGGAIKFDGKNFTSYTKEQGLADNTIYGISQDNKGNLVFASSEGGISCYDGKNFHNLNESGGLLSDLIYTVKVDTKNNYWLGTNKGLNKVRLSNYFELDSSKIYTDINGLAGTEFLSNSLYFDHEGIIWAGTTEGLTRFNTELDYKNSTPPKIMLQEIRLSYQKVNWKKYAENIDPKTGLPVDLQLNYKNNHLTFEFQALTTDNNVKYRYMLEGLENRWSPSKSSTEAIYANIPSGRDYIFRVQAVNSDGVWSTSNIEYHFTIQSPIWQRWWFRILAIIGSVTSLIVFINFRTKRLAQEKKILEDKVEERTGELKETNSKLNVAFTDIKDSINYAQRIQQAILPVESKIKELLPDSFILFKPRDVVSGDFYWFGTVEKNKETYHIIAAADCTGHGVPGAFMSMIGNTILNEIVITKEIISPSEILSQLHNGVRKALKQNQNTSRDGMDICLCCIHTKSLEVTYAGAFNPLWILRSDKTVEVIKATKSAIGGFTADNQIFESHAVQLKRGESIYLFTDGYADQFGGDNGKKLTTKKFRDTIVEMHDKSMQEQGFYLNNFIEIWRGKEFQVDDILVIGIRL